MSSRLFDDANTESLEATSWSEVTAAPFTVFCRAKSDVTNITGVSVGISDSDTTNNYWILYFHSTGALAWQATDSGAIGAAIGGTVVADTWHTCCGVEAASNDRTAYLDAGSGTQNTDDRTPDGVDILSIGALRFGGSRTFHFSGNITDVLIVDSAATTAEVANFDSGYLPRRFRPKNILGFWPTLGDDSPEVDHSFKNNPASLLNSPAKSTDSPPNRFPRLLFDRSHRNRSRGMRRQIAKGTSTGGFDP